MEILQFIFKDFWHFIGTVILICLISSSIESLLESIRYLFCKHEFEYSGEDEEIEQTNGHNYRETITKFYICKKCGKIKEIKVDK